MKIQISFLLIWGILFGWSCAKNSKDTNSGTDPSDTNPPSTDGDSDSDTDTDTDNDDDRDTDSTNQIVSTDGADEITVTLIEDPDNSPPIVYVIWLENEDHTFVQNLYICSRVIDGSLTGTPLPYWYMNKRNNSEIDGLSGATVVPSFTVSRELAEEASGNITVYAEVDHSFDNNDWFINQPALLYAVDVNLNQIHASYTMTPIGWTKASQNTYTAAVGAPTTEDGELNTEMRYITHTSSDGGFGEEDERSATHMVESIRVSFD
ncbi:MAG: hypothetical protein JXX29_14950 [Deltaproteobacteria bacterium]|nr:hypothetical protein [Deltaproteobacteria bacterium]MBN2672978.1 hypothetical protein [Deltaproteobacteria bacterium]